MRDHVKKIGQATLAWAVVCFVLALVWDPSLRMPQFWILVGISVLANIFQPAYRLFEAQRVPEDRWTASQIVWTVYVSQIAALSELVLRQRESLPIDWVFGVSLFGMVAGLFLRSFSRVLAVDLGFDADKLLVVRMRLDGESYGGGGAHPYYTRFLEKIRALPGVVAAGGTTGLPMDELDIDFDRPFWREGEPRPDGGGVGAQIRMPTVGYFEAMRIPLLEGREVDIRDDRTKPRVLIVNETMARQTWPGASPVGQRLLIDYQNYEAVYDVVGVVGDTRFYGHKKATRRATSILVYSSS